MPDLALSFIIFEIQWITCHLVLRIKPQVVLSKLSSQMLTILFNLATLLPTQLFLMKVLIMCTKISLPDCSIQQSLSCSICWNHLIFCNREFCWTLLQWTHINGYYAIFKYSSKTWFLMLQEKSHDKKGEKQIAKQCIFNKTEKPWRL